MVDGELLCDEWKKGRGEHDEKEIVIITDESLRKTERMLQ